MLATIPSATSTENRESPHFRSFFRGSDNTPKEDELISICGVYSYSVNNSPVTDREFQPDVIQFFIKPDKNNDNIMSRSCLSSVNLMGMLLLASCVTGAFRVFYALYYLFHCPSEYDEIGDHHYNIDKWDLVKNIFRGLVEIIPLTGLILVIYEYVRKTLCMWNVKKELEGKENIAGVAINGKVVTTIELDDYKDEVLQEIRVEKLSRICCTYLGKLEQHSSQRLAQKFSDFLSSEEIREEILGGSASDTIVDNYAEHKRFIEGILIERRFDRTTQSGYRRAYRRLALDFHPDRHPEQTSNWSALNGWWTIFSNSDEFRRLRS